MSRSRRCGAWPTRPGAAAGGSSSSREVPASARRACSPRRARLLARGGCGCSRAAAGGAGAGLGGGELGGGLAGELCEPLLAAASPDLRAELLSGPAALIAPLLGASQPAGSQDVAAEGSFAIVHGLYWLAANVALQRPTLLAIDDLHWADTPSLRWLLYLTRRLEGVPLLVVAGGRPPGW